MSFKLLITFEGFKNEESAVAALNQHIVNLGGVLHHNSFNKEDKDVYTVTIVGKPYYGEPEADVCARVTRKPASDVEFINRVSKTKELGLNDS